MHKVLLTLRSFLEDETAEAKPKFPFIFLRLPPAPPRQLFKDKEILVLREWRTNGGSWNVYALADTWRLM